MSRWFRFYADAMRHPKVAKLNDAQFRLWVELLSVAAENEGRIPAADDLKHMLKKRLDHLLRGLDDLIRASLIEPLEGGYTPHGWAKRQYKSDVSTSRVRKHREKGNVSETPPDTETDIPLAKANGAAPEIEASDAQFWRTAKSYIGGNNPGAMIGKWCRDFGKPATAQAITASQLERAVEPKSFIEAALRRAKVHDDEKPKVPL